jgi:methylamine dehydrogenase accessory protein MauD
MDQSLPFIVSYVLLWLLLLFIAAVLLVVVREVALLRVRIGPEPGALATDEGPKIGALLPQFEATALSGVPVRMGPRPGSTVLVFASPHCRPCRDLLPALQRVVRRATRIQFVLIVHGDQSEVESLMRLYELDAPVIADADHRISKLFGVETVPVAILADGDWTVVTKGIVNNEEHLEALLRKQVTPQGDRDFTSVPDLIEAVTERR